MLLLLAVMSLPITYVGAYWLAWVNWAGSHAKLFSYSGMNFTICAVIAATMSLMIFMGLFYAWVKG